MTVAMSRISIPIDFEGTEIKTVEELTRPVYEIIDRIEMPIQEGDLKDFIPQYNKPPEKDFVNYYDAGANVAGLNHPQMVLLGQEISKRVGSRYVPLTFQTAYNEAHSGHYFRKLLKHKWVHNAELFVESRGVIPIPTVEEKDGKFVYSGEIREVWCKKESMVVDVLKEAGILEMSTNEIMDRCIFFENGLASASSYWDSEEECFHSYYSSPSDNNVDSVAVFERLEPSKK